MQEESGKITQFIIVAHSTKVHEGKIAMQSLLSELQANMPNYHITDAYLDIEPSIEERVASAVQNGINQIIVFPYFLHLGVHVAKELPQVISVLQSRYAGIDIEVTEHLGANRELTALITNTANTHLKEILHKKPSSI